MTTILVTGAAGFIGFHVAQQLIARRVEVVGVDDLNDYYALQLKQDRLRQLDCAENFRFEQFNIADTERIVSLFKNTQFDAVVHLAAQAGVRYSLLNPYAYIDSNLVGFSRILEGCRHFGVKHLVFASSSSVYGLNKEVPFAVAHNVDYPASLYAATKRANELMAFSYSHLYNIAATGLRFFTVYGPWGRPDMAIYAFADAIMAGRPIQLFNNGRMRRDFTYIDDVVEGVVRVMDRPPYCRRRSGPEEGGVNSSDAPYILCNIGNSHPVELLQIVELLERNLGRKAICEMVPMQPGDVIETYADVSELARDTGFRPHTPIEEGIRRFVEWYRWYHGLLIALFVFPEVTRAFYGVCGRRAPKKCHRCAIRFVVQQWQDRGCWSAAVGGESAVGAADVRRMSADDIPISLSAALGVMSSPTWTA